MTRTRRPSLHWRAAVQPLLAQQDAPKLRRTACILLWMAGGMAQTETFDPKKYTPYEPGSRASACSAPSRRFRHRRGQHPALAGPRERRQDHGSRHAASASHRVGDLGFILHSRHQYHWHTGYEPPQSVAVPHMGAMDRETARAANIRTCRRSSSSGRTWRSARRAIR